MSREVDRKEGREKLADEGGAEAGGEEDEEVRGGNRNSVRVKPVDMRCKVAQRW